MAATGSGMDGRLLLDGFVLSLLLSLLSLVVVLVEGCGGREEEGCWERWRQRSVIAGC